MKRWVYLLAVVLAVAFLSGKRADVANLRPVEVVSVTQSDGGIRIVTDSGDSGNGTDVGTAIKDLKATTPAEIFLETGEYLLVTEECLSCLPELMEHLRPSCAVCLVNGEPDMKEVAQYLKIHPPKRTLAEYRAGIKELPVLKVEEGRMELVS